MKSTGNIIGQHCKQSVIDSSVRDFYVKANMVLSHFSNASHHVRYKLFQTYCMSLYGCQLWDYQDNITNKFYVAWRKVVRRVLGLPTTTHCKYIHNIAEDHDIKEQLYIRFVKFIQSLHQSSNVISKLCVKLSLRGSRSNSSNNMALLCKYYSIERNNLLFCATNKLKGHLDDEHTLSVTSMVRELLYMKYQCKFSPEQFILSANEMDNIITFLCVD